MGIWSNVGGDFLYKIAIIWLWSYINEQEIFMEMKVTERKVMDLKAMEMKVTEMKVMETKV